MTAVRIIGLGSPQGADRAGWIAVETLRDAGFHRRFPAGTLSLALCAGPHELPALLEGCRLAILFDALRSPGDRIRLFDESALAASALHCSVHALGLKETLELVHTLAPDGGPRVLLAGIPAGATATPDLTRRAVAGFCPLLAEAVHSRLPPAGAFAGEALFNHEGARRGLD